MDIDLLNSLFDRKRILQAINSQENKNRKAISFRQSEIFSDRQHQYVVNYLYGQYSAETVAEMPVISSVNLCQRIVKQEASIYKHEPTREFSEISDEQKEKMLLVYEDMELDNKLQRCNENYRLQNQTTLQIIPKNGKLIAKPYKMHQIDVIPREDDPEKAYAYIISAFDRSIVRSSLQTDILSNATGRSLSELTVDLTDGLNQEIADSDDYKKSLDKYVVWTDEYNFIMNGNGEIVGEILPNEIGMLPFIDITGEKDYEFYNRQGQSVSEFSIQYNGALSDFMNVIRLQGFGQAYMIAEEDVLATNIKIGPNYVLRIPKRADGAQPEFGFANPNPDIDGSMGFLEFLLANFMSSRGIDPKTISGKSESSNFSSAAERFLAMIEKFDASKSDFALFQRVEAKAYNIIKSWLNVMRTSSDLDDKYKMSLISEKSEVSTLFERPEMIQTESEQLTNIKQKLELGLISEVEALMEVHGLDRKAAEERLEQIREDEDAQMLRSKAKRDMFMTPGNDSQPQVDQNMDPNAEDIEEDDLENGDNAQS